MQNELLQIFEEMHIPQSYIKNKLILSNIMGKSKAIVMHPNVKHKKRKENIFQWVDY